MDLEAALNPVPAPHRTRVDVLALQRIPIRDLGALYVQGGGGARVGAAHPYP